MRTSLEKNLTPLPRTISEANRDAKYACAIQTFRSDTKLTLDFLADVFLGALWTAVVIGGAGACIYWLAFSS
jgi:hypothetical protein